MTYSILQSEYNRKTVYILGSDINKILQLRMDYRTVLIMLRCIYRDNLGLDLHKDFHFSTIYSDKEKLSELERLVMEFRGKND